MDKSRRTCGQNGKRILQRKNCIDRSVIQTIIIDFCDDDSDDDAGKRIIILSIIDREEKYKSN